MAQRHHSAERKSIVGFVLPPPLVVIPSVPDGNGRNLHGSVPTDNNDTTTTETPTITTSKEAVEHRIGRARSHDASG